MMLEQRNAALGGWRSANAEPGIEPGTSCIRVARILTRSSEGSLHTSFEALSINTQIIIKIIIKIETNINSKISCSFTGSKPLRATKIL